MTDSVEEPFVLEGIKRYGAARDTLQTFETLIHERLSQILKSYSFPDFEAKKASLATGLKEKRGGHWIWARQRRALASRGNVTVEIGLVWKDLQVAYYCNLLDDDTKVIDFSYRRNHPGVVLQLWSKSARLFMVATNDGVVALEAHFKVLLDELLHSFTG